MASVDRFQAVQLSRNRFGVRDNWASDMTGDVKTEKLVMAEEGDEFSDGDAEAAKAAHDEAVARAEAMNEEFKKSFVPNDLSEEDMGEEGTEEGSA